MRPFYPLLAALALGLVPLTAQAQITVALSGNWSDPATWSGGAVPTATDDVVIDSTVTIDVDDAVANNVTIRGEGDADGWLRMDRGGVDNVAKGITIFGDLTIDADGEFRPLSNQDEDTSVGFGEIYHRLTIHGSIDNSSGGTFDMRRGATSTDPPSAAFIDLIFAGDEDATLHLGDYDNNDNQLFRTEIAKENGATVTLLNDATMDNNSRATFTLTSGYLDTGDFRFTLISNNSSVVVGGSPASYVIGELARGLPKGTVSSQNNRFYPVGDEDGYRPVTVYVTERPSDDQFFGVRAISGDADSGSSTFEGGLTDVSPVRYYAFEWYFFDSSDAINIDRIEISYGGDDEVPEGSTDFVVASSIDDFTTWTNAGGFDTDGTTAHLTSLASPPTAIQSGDLSGWEFDFEVVGTDVVGDVYYAAVGTTGAFGTSVSRGPEVEALRLGASPNPTSGSATISFALDAPADVTVEVFDVMGRRVATLADGTLAAGAQELTWDGAGLAAGLYHVRLRAGSVVAARTLSIVR
ncbi:MAG: FlgD immunoglobulin-like domain containing protein [Bacteroidota bacterium]